MKKELLDKLTAEPGRRHSVSDFDPEYNAVITKETAAAKLQDVVAEIADLQNKLYAEDRHSILIIFQAMDAAGKDGTIEHVMSGINPQGCQVVAFKQPSFEELDHDYLWRVYRKLPERGRIGIFNRSHYEEVIVTKVHPELVLKERLVGVRKIEDVDKNFWENRYRQINDFERHLTENGVTVIKFFLNISRGEQEKRFLERLEDKAANWKFSLGDVKESSFWDSYMEAYSDMLTETSTERAPWYVIPADKKWFMRWAVAKIILERMKELDLRYPELTPEQQEDLKAAVDMVNGEKSKASKAKKKEAGSDK